MPIPDRVLWPNQFVKARLHLGLRKDALVVPAVAVQRGPSGAFAYVVGEDKTVAARPVEVDSTDTEFAVIRAGLTLGETVVTEGQFQLKPGALVETREPARATRRAATRGKVRAKRRRARRRSRGTSPSPSSGAPSRPRCS